MRISLPKAICVIILAAAAAHAQAPAASRRRPPGAGVGPPRVVPLHDGWKFREAGKGAWHAAEVPGCVHTDLMKAGLIEDPFYRDNEKRPQWVGKTDWEYETTFRVGGEVLGRGNSLDGAFGDDFFDLLPGREVAVDLRPRRAVSLAELRRMLLIHHSPFIVPHFS